MELDSPIAQSVIHSLKGRLAIHNADRQIQIVFEFIIHPALFLVVLTSQEHVGLAKSFANHRTTSAFSESFFHIEVSFASS